MPKALFHRLLNRRINPGIGALIYIAIAGIWVTATKILIVYPIGDLALQNVFDLALDLVFVAMTGAVLYFILRLWNANLARRLTHLYATLSRCNQTIVRSANMRELLPELCQHAVQLGGMKLAWIGLVDEATQRVIPVVWSGEGAEYLDGIRITLNADEPHGLGPVGTSIRENRPVWCDDFMHDPRNAAWHARSARYNWGAIAALPLRQSGRNIGVFCLYTGVPNAFDEAERGLLEEMAVNINYALDHFERAEAREKAEQQVRNVLAMTQHFLDNLPGSAFIKDRDLRLLFASRGFVDMFGLEPKDIIGKSNEEIYTEAFAKKISEDDRQVLRTGETIIVNDKHDGKHFESIKFVIDDQDDSKLLGGIKLDITQRYLLMARQQALLEINELGALLPEQTFLERGLQIAERLTDSEISFLHFVADDQAQLEMSVYSKKVDRAGGGTNAVFDVNDTEYCEECIRSKKVVVHNHQESLVASAPTALCGMPVAHLLAAPIVENNKVRMIIGVANKVVDYDNADIVTMLLIGNDLWRIAHRRRVETAMHQQLQELKELNKKLEKTHNQLVQSEKMAAIGQLAAGIAHEINNPISFVQSNFTSLTEYVDDLLAIDSAYNEIKQQAGGKTQKAFERVQQLKANVGHDFIVQDVRNLIKESREGLERVSRIVRDLRDFTHVGETGWQHADLHQGLDSTINIVRSVVKEQFGIDREYGVLPAVYCIPAQLNQVFLNLLVNAAQSVEGNGKIVVKTVADENNVSVEIQDNGAGITPEHMKHLFEPFFTTKPPGKGTGLGLSLSWGIVQRHKGNIEVHSDPGVKTVFKVSLPINGQQERA